MTKYLLQRSIGASGFYMIFEVPDHIPTGQVPYRNRKDMVYTEVFDTFDQAKDHILNDLSKIISDTSKRFDEWFAADFSVLSEFKDGDLQDIETRTKSAPQKIGM